MDSTLILLLISALGIGFLHAFELDHVVAISSLMLNNKSWKTAASKGALWGLGHTTTLFLMGAIFIYFRLTVNEIFFSYLEALVGIMIFCLGIWRLQQIIQKKTVVLPHNHIEIKSDVSVFQNFKLPYGIGIIHGLAGSGSLILAVLTQTKSSPIAVVYLLIFGLGSVFGMMLISSLMNTNLLKNIFNNKSIQFIFVLISALLCLFLGAYIIYQNLF